jgi:hypothetical protein
MGRPPLSAKMKRDKRLVVMFTEEELGILAGAAANAGKSSVNDWARSLLLNNARLVPEDACTAPAGTN